MYSVEEIKELLSAFDNSKATALDIQIGADEFISIRQKTAKPAAVQTEYTPAVQIQAAPEILSAAVVEEKHETKAEGTAVESPMVGVFYAAPSPDSDPYVSVGSKVNKGDVLCLIEAMKLMNEVTAEKSGEIAEICVENGQVVEYGQPLFRIK
ncbi:MAG: acetyl-CoA carboxylase biotin carboxyl carrier protein [Clostridia bacterium]|nr:acetyl-CoA carboxylase biotin carboxyl carrier protein [Clostridia bacterium]